MFEPVLIAIDKALETLKTLKAVDAHPLDLLITHIYPRWKCYLKPGHEPANDLSPRGVLLRAEKPASSSAPSSPWNVTTDAETLDLWLKTQLQPVLKALSEDKVAARVLTTMLPEPWMYEMDLEFYLQGTSRDILDQRQRIMEQRQRVLDESGGGNVGVKPEGVASAEREAEERKRTAEVEWEGAFLGLPAVTVVTSRVEKKVWDEDGPWCYRGSPAVWLWAIWRFWPVLIRGQAIRPVPAWPHADDCTSQSGDRFRVALIANVGHRLESFPGEAAKGLMWALEELGEKLAPGKAGKKASATVDPRTAARLRKLEAAEAFIPTNDKMKVKKEMIAKHIRKETGLPCHPTSVPRLLKPLRAKGLHSSTGKKGGYFFRPKK